jgi:hypothetical protein
MQYKKIYAGVISARNPVIWAHRLSRRQSLVPAAFGAAISNGTLFAHFFYEERKGSFFILLQ